ncbi:hypothetical protein D1007_28706 [Hordeum vulgare]|nr:hypothetical protein D1007_28706 [Hordeum vulgare]
MPRTARTRFLWRRRRCSRSPASKAAPSSRASPTPRRGRSAGRPGKASATCSAAPCASCRRPSPRSSRSPRAASRRRTSTGSRPATPWTRPSPAPLADTAAAAAVPPYPCHPHCPAAPPTRLRHTPLAIGRVSRDIVCRSSTVSPDSSACQTWGGRRRDRYKSRTISWSS